MKNKSVIFFMVCLMIASIGFSSVAYGGAGGLKENTTPPIPLTNKSTTGSSSGGTTTTTDSGFETPTIPFEGDTTTAAKVTVGRPTLKLKAGKRSFTASWSKVKGANGYILQYSTSKSFKKKKTIKIKSAKTLKRKVKKLKKGKKYYVRVKAYKVVNKKTYTSKWSKKLYVKTK